MFKVTLQMLLISAFVLGVIVACDKVSSTVSGTSGRKLTLVAPADQSVRQGDANKVAIAIIRTNFDTAVEIEVTDLPAGVSIAGGTKLSIPSGALKIDSVTLVAAADAAVVDGHRVSVTAKGPDGISVTEFFKVSVTPRN